VPHLGGSRGEHFGRGVDKVDNHLLVRLPLLIPRASNPQHAKNAAPQQPAGSNYFSEHCSNIRGKEEEKTQGRAGTNLEGVFVFIAVVAEDALWV